MSFLESLFLGGLQGFTEFLPISSSGHLFLTEVLFGFKPNLNFEILLHIGSLIAVMAFFWSDIWKILRGMCQVKKEKEEGILGWQLALATLATIPVAIFLESKTDIFFSMWVLGVSFIVTGICIFLAEKFRPSHTRPFTWGMAVILGLVQGIAALPALSRSGLTIAFLIFAGVERKKALEISFLLSIPAILGAFVFSLSDGAKMAFGFNEIIATIVSCVVAFATIRWMLTLIKKGWIWFAPYCVLVGIAVLIWE
jgi:undecaprenyl-diphosphatase